MDQPLGFMIVYVEDIMVTAESQVVQSFMECLQSHWTTSPPEFVNESHWVKFCGLELRRDDRGGLLVGQQAYARELIRRHEVSRTKPVPMTRDEEETPDPVKLKEAQGLIGELLWLAVRSRPDLSFTVSMMGQQALKRPSWVVDVGRDALMYVAGTPELCLRYDRCQAGDRGGDQALAFSRAMSAIEVFSDASFAPAGARSHQGLLGMYGGGLIQWEATRQPLRC